MIDPIKGFYDSNIVVLDFASLYPSIIIAHNLCYCTLISPSREKIMLAKDYEKTPLSHCFVKSNIKKGVLPEICEEMILARRRVKE